MKLTFDRVANWDGGSYETYAASCMASWGISDPAGKLRLADLLRVHAPEFLRAARTRRDAQTITTYLWSAAKADPTSGDGHDGTATTEAGVLSDPTDEIPGPEWLQRLAVGLWETWGPERLSSRQYPAISAAIVEPLAVILSGSAKIRAAEGAIVAGGSVIGHIVDPDGNTSRSYEALATVAGHRLIRFVVGQAWLAALRGDAQPDDVQVRGGWRRLSEMLGLGSRSAAQDLQRAGEALGHLHLRTPIGLERILDVGASRVRDRVTVGLRARGPLALDFVHRLRLAEKRDRLLVPLSPAAPPLTAHRQSHAQQMSFEMMLLAEFRRRVRRPLGDFLRFPGSPEPLVVAEIGEHAVSHAAGAVGLSPRNRAAILNVWQRDAGSGGWFGTGTARNGARFLYGRAALMNPFLSAGMQMSEVGREAVSRRKRGRGP